MDHSATTVYNRFSRWYGQAEYRLRPGLAHRQGGPFNGQVLRQACYGELLRRFGFTAIVETGGYRGVTTSLFAQANVPVYSIEANVRFAAYAATRLRHSPHVEILQGDSRAGLRELAQRPQVPKRNVFFYLDAHWFDDLPLREEIEIIREHWSEWVIMVDDFEVPGTSYGYDAYGPGQSLQADYLRPLCEHTPLFMFYPAFAPEAETGARRGCVVLGNTEPIAAQLADCYHLNLECGGHAAAFPHPKP